MAPPAPTRNRTEELVALIPMGISVTIALTPPMARLLALWKLVSPLTSIFSYEFTIRALWNHSSPNVRLVLI
jgi:hypothetical protein